MSSPTEQSPAFAAAKSVREPDRGGRETADGLQTDGRAEELRRLLKACRRISQTLDIQSRRIARDSGLTLPQIVVLGAVRDHGESTVRAIARDADLTPATVVGILDKLESKGLTERHRSTVDRRVVHTRLTPAGVKALHEAPPLLGAVFEEAYFRLDPERRRAILDAFDRVATLDGAHDPVAEDAADSPAH